MSKRGDNIRKRKDGRWEGRYKIGNYPSGATKYSSVYGHSYAEVKEKLKLIEGNPMNMLSVKKNSLLFKDALLMWMSNNKIKHKGSTENKYLYLIENHIIPELGDIKISDINSSVVNDFLNTKLDNGRLDNKGGLSNSYVRNMSHIISSTLTFAVNEQLCLPIKNQIVKPVVEKKDFEVLTLLEQQRLETFLLNDMDENKFGIYLSLNMGLRIGEICALAWDDFDLENDVLHIRSTVARVRSDNKEQKTILIIDKPKTKTSIRDIPLSSKIKPVVLFMWQRRKSKFVVPSISGFISPRTYEYRYHRILEECNIKSINYHVLRHTFATRCVEVGIDVKTLSEILGHANVSITLNTYVHSSISLKRTQLEKLTAYSA